MDFSEIYRRYAPHVHRFSIYLSGNPALAEDLTAETFVHALCGRTSLRVDTVKAYLFGITRNLYRDLIGASGGSYPSPRWPSLPIQPLCPDRAVENQQTFSAVLKAIQRLPELQREALVLSMDEDLSYDQIAAILGCSLAAVKVRIHRARLHLKSDLEAEDRTWKT